MKRILICILLIVLAVSCSGLTDAGPAPAQSISHTRKVPLRLRSSGSRSLDLCAFRSDGSLYAHVRREGDSITAELAAGETMIWWLVADAPEELLETTASLAQLERAKVLLEDNTRESFVMTGYGAGVLTGNTEKVLNMRRLACKVSVGKLIPSFLGEEEYAGKRAVLERAFLLNAPSAVFLDGKPSADDMCNVGCLDSGLPRGLSDLVSCDLASNLEGTAACSLDLSLYCCPNPLGSTSLVLELSIEGETNYYPISLPPLQSNCEYHVPEVELLGDGSVSPDLPVDRKSVGFTIVVNPWENEYKNLILD